MDSETEEQVFISYFIPKLSNSTTSSIIYRQLKMSLGFNDYLSDGIPDNLSYVSNDRSWPRSSTSTSSPAAHLNQVLYPHRSAGAKPGALGQEFSSPELAAPTNTSLTLAADLVHTLAPALA
jgi:hypothetical protein